jgi:hypothetical protein
MIKSYLSTILKWWRIPGETFKLMIINDIVAPETAESRGLQVIENKWGYATFGQFGMGSEPCNSLRINKLKFGIGQVGRQEKRC